MSGDRGAQRWEQRRRAVRQVSLALGLLLLVAVAFAVWLALDAPDTRAPESLGVPAPGPAATAVPD